MNKLKEINELRHKIYNEIIKDEEVAEMLKSYEQVYVYEIFHGNKHDIVTVGRHDQLKGFLNEKNYDINKCLIQLLYTVNKQTKTCI